MRTINIIINASNERPSLSAPLGRVATPVSRTYTRPSRPLQIHSHYYRCSSLPHRRGDGDRRAMVVSLAPCWLHPDPPSNYPPPLMSSPCHRPPRLPLTLYLHELAPLSTFTSSHTTSGFDTDAIHPPFHFILPSTYITVPHILALHASSNIDSTYHLIFPTRST